MRLYLRGLLPSPSGRGVGGEVIFANSMVSAIHLETDLNKISASLRFRQHIEKRLRIIDRNHGSIEIAAVAGDDGIGPLTDG